MRSRLRRQTRLFYSCATLFPLVILAVASCAPSKPPSPAASIPAPPPPPPARVVRPQLHASWSFQTTQDACVAMARAGTARFTITVHSTGPVRLTLTLPTEPPERAIGRFSGTAGSWEIGPAAVYRHAAIFALPRTETTLSRVLVLLSGGQLALERSDAAILDLPESGPAGRHWFRCARQSVNGA